VPGKSIRKLGHVCLIQRVGSVQDGASSPCYRSAQV
jgi:hypothetical protein